MKYILYLFIATVLLAVSPSCAMAPNAVAVIGVEQTTVTVKLVERYDTTVRVRFLVSDSNYSHIVQEITLYDGSVLIEAFLNDGWIVDRHYWPTRPERRYMKVYAANVVGMDSRNGWGHLPDNGQGLETTIDRDFNQTYQLFHKTTGSVTSRSAVATYWSIIDDGVTVTVLLPR